MQGEISYIKLIFLIALVEIAHDTVYAVHNAKQIAELFVLFLLIFTFLVERFFPQANLFK